MIYILISTHFPKYLASDWLSPEWISRELDGKGALSHEARDKKYLAKCHKYISIVLYLNCKLLQSIKMLVCSIWCIVVVHLYWVLQVLPLFYISMYSSAPWQMFFSKHIENWTYPIIKMLQIKFMLRPRSSDKNNLRRQTHFINFMKLRIVAH